MSELKPLPKKVTDEIRFILEGCKSGRLNHDQTMYHCGTAHCIAGWKAVLDYAKTKHDKKVLTTDFDAVPDYIHKVDTFIEKKNEAYTEWEYAEAVWKLTDTEAAILFRDNSTFREQFALLKKLEKGKRVV